MNDVCWKRLLTAALLLSNLAGCTGVSRALPFSRRAPRMVQQREASTIGLHSHLMRSAEQAPTLSSATASANEPKEL